MSFIYQHYRPILYTITLVAIFFFFLYPVQDPDLGWHLRYGEYFLNNQSLLRANHFSWIMPDYQWPNHSWGSDVILAILFKSSNFLGISLIGTTLITLTFALTFYKHKFSHHIIYGALLFMFFGQYTLNAGLRSRFFSLLGTVYLWHSLNSFISNKKQRLWEIPAIFLIWAQLHGQHIFGLGLLVLFTIGYLIRPPTPTKTRQKRHLLIITLLSALATLINPYGIDLVTTTISHLSSPALPNIFEWMPWNLTSPRMIALLIYMAFFWYFIYLKRKSFSLSQILVLAALTLMAIKARRIIILFTLISAPIFLGSIQSLYQKPAQYFKLAALPLAIIVSTISIYLASNRNVFHQSWDTYCNSTILCSDQLIEFMKTHKLQGRIFNSYRLGGYLIYRYPQEKVFIDGRMTLWQNDSGNLPFLEYLDIIHAKSSARSKFLQYAFDYVILQPQFELAGVLKNQENWINIYQDSNVVIYQNPFSKVATPSSTLIH